MIIVRDPLTQDANRIDAKGRQITRGFTESEGVYETSLGNSYNSNTGNITLTSASESAIAYLKNAEPYDMVIASTFVITGTSTSGVGNAYVTIERNPTAGTIVSNATAGDVLTNRNFGSSNMITSLFYKGAEGYTLTGSDGDVLRSIMQATNRVAYEMGSIFLPRGSSIGVLFTPPASNTSMVVQVAFQFFLETVQTPGS